MLPGALAALLPVFKLVGLYCCTMRAFKWLAGRQASRQAGRKRESLFGE